MPLRAVRDTANIHAFEFNDAQWAELKAAYRSWGLHMPCCDCAAIPKTSSRGNNFFAHARKGECTTALERPEHLYCKQLIAQAAQSAGWTVITEWPGSTPGGEQWIADVFCQKGSAKIAFEVQMSPQTHAETVRRQLRYKASNVRGAWFFASEIRPSTVVFDRDTPAFVLSPFEVGQIPTIRRFDVHLPEFIVGMLSKRLVWDIPEYNKPLYVEFMPDTCWSCQRAVKQVYGHLEKLEHTQGEWHPRACTPASISTALESVQAVISNEELVAQSINPIGKRDVIRGKKTNWPYSNLCLHCRAPQENFQFGEKLRTYLNSPEFYVPEDDGENWEENCNEDGNESYRVSEADKEALKARLCAINRTIKGGGRWLLRPNDTLLN